MFNKASNLILVSVIVVALISIWVRHEESRKYLNAIEQRYVSTYGRSSQDFKKAIDKPSQSLSDAAIKLAAGREEVPAEEIFADSSPVKAAAVELATVALEKAPCLTSRRERSDQVRDVVELLPVLLTNKMDVLRSGYRLIYRVLEEKCGPAATDEAVASEIDKPAQNSKSFGECPEALI